MRQAGRYLPEYRTLRAQQNESQQNESRQNDGVTNDGFIAFCRSESATTQAALQPLRRFCQLDAAIVFSDILVIAEALGLRVSFGVGGPVLDKPLDDRAIEKLLEDRVSLEPHRYDFVARACQGLAQGLQENHFLVPTIGFAGAPWTLACYLLQGRAEKNFPRACAFVRRAPDLADAFLALLAREAADLLAAQRTGGAEVFQLFDSWSGLLHGKENTRFSLTPAKAVFRLLREGEAHAAKSSETRFSTPLIFHARGAGVAWQEVVRQFSGLDVALSPDASVDLAALVGQLETLERDPALTRKIVVQGNLDPQFFLPSRDGSEMCQVLQAKAQAMRGRPWVVNLGSGIPPDAAPERVAEFLSAVKEIQA